MAKNAGDTIIAPGDPSVQVFIASGSWSKPNGVRGVRVRGCGTGGGSGGCTGAGTGNAVSGAGGGGGYFEAWIPAASLLATETVTVGAAAAAASPGSGGGTGTPTSFGAHCSATSGTGGGTMTSTTGSAIAAGGNGGTASGGDINIPGGDGALGQVVSGVAVHNSLSGACVLGPGKRMSTAAGTPGNGGSYGSGAPSGWVTTGNANGGVGGGGVVIVESIY